MEDIDLNEYNSMKKILENDVTHWGLSWTYYIFIIKKKVHC